MCPAWEIKKGNRSGVVRQRDGHGGTPRLSIAGRILGRACGRKQAISAFLLETPLVLRNPSEGQQQNDPDTGQNMADTGNPGDGSADRLAPKESRPKILRKIFVSRKETLDFHLRMNIILLELF